MELLIVAATIGVLLTMIPVFVQRLSLFMWSARSQTTLQRDGRSAIEQVVRILKQGTSTGILIDSPAGEPPYSRIQISIPTTGKTVVFRQEGNLLVREDDGNRQILSRDLVALYFTFPDARDHTYIGVTISLQQSFGNNRNRSVNLTYQPVRVMNNG